MQASLVNTTFFFLSGIFFKRTPIKQFLLNKFKTLIIPFLVFYLLSYPFRIALHYWDFRELQTFDYLCIFDIFDVAARSDYLFVNVPLWFILCLFFVQLYYYVIEPLPKPIIFVIAIASLLTESITSNIPTPFMINNAIYYLGYFALGNLFGAPLINFLKAKRNRLIALAISIPLCLYFYAYYHFDLSQEHICSLAYWISVFFVLFAVFSWFDHSPIFRPLRYLGQNTLIILCAHVPILIVFSRISYRITRTHHSALGFICALLTLLVIHFIIQFINNKAPLLIGKNKTH